MLDSVQPLNTVLLGDFNIDLMGKSSETFKNMCISKGLTNKLKNQVSTDGKKTN